jgi:hypothetical protein
MTRKPTLGTVSHATLRTEDLIDAFSDELSAIVCAKDRTESERELLSLASAWLGREQDDEAPKQDIHEEEGSQLVNDLVDALNDHAPACTYFGAHEGDGSDFGFWPSWDAIDELPRIADPGEAEAHLGEECVFVNDHGNVTLYNADGTVAWDCV